MEPGQLLLKLHWNGGDHTALAVLKNRVGQHRGKTSPATEQLIGDLARVAPDQSIAAILDRLGMRTGKGHTWTQQRVRSFRNDHGIRRTAMVSGPNAVKSLWRSRSPLGRQQDDRDPSD